MGSIAVTEKENGLKNDRETAPCSEKISREELLVKVSELVRILHHRTTTPRFKAGQHDRPRLAYARATTAVMATYGNLLKDVEIDELKRRIEVLEREKERE